MDNTKCPSIRGEGECRQNIYDCPVHGVNRYHAAFREEQGVKVCVGGSSLGGFTKKERQQ